MSEIKPEQPKKEEELIASHPTMGNLDKRTYEAIAEACRKDGSGGYQKIVPRSLEEMGFLFDENIKCHMHCDQSDLMGKIKRMVENRENTDVKVNVNGHIFRCHLSILQIFTEYFKKFKAASYIAISSRELTAIGFKRAYDWMIQMKAWPTRRNIVDMYVAAHFLKMEILLKQLWYCFGNVEFFNEGQAFKLFLEAVPHKAITLQEVLLTRVNYFFLSAVATYEFLQLGAEQVYAMLRNHCISVNCEMEILMTMMRWMSYDWETRKAYIPMIIRAVRFELLPAWYLLSLKGKLTHPEMQEVVDHPIVEALLTNGLSEAITKQFTTESSPLTEILQLQHATERHWIIDEKAAHHHLYQCPNWKYLDFMEFTSYIERIMKGGKLFSKTLKRYSLENLMPCCRALLSDCPAPK